MLSTAPKYILGRLAEKKRAGHEKPRLVRGSGATLEPADSETVESGDGGASRFPQSEMSGLVIAVTPLPVCLPPSNCHSVRGSIGSALR